tara:strand:- start:260 stop:718 length:459 start_codon:yes stop_codon:yes gene_type:complete
MYKKKLIVFIAGVLVLASCGGGGSVKVDTGLEDLTGIDSYIFSWVDDSDIKQSYYEFCTGYEDQKCYQLNGKIKEVTLEPYLPDSLRGSCYIGGDLAIDTTAIENALEDGATVELTGEDFEVFSFETDDGKTVNTMEFYIEDCDYIKVTVKS